MKSSDGPVTFVIIALQNIYFSKYYNMNICDDATGKTELHFASFYFKLFQTMNMFINSLSKMGGWCEI